MRSVFKCVKPLGQRELDSQLTGEILKTCAALILCPQLWLATNVVSLLFLLEQNKEVHALFSRCEMECLLSVDCMQFTEGKLRATCVKGHNSHLSFFKKALHSQCTIQSSMEAHKANKLKIIPTVLDHIVSQ